MPASQSSRLCKFQVLIHFKLSVLKRKLVNNLVYKINNNFNRDENLPDLSGIPDLFFKELVKH